MRTGLFLLAGLLLAAASAIVGRLFSENYPSATTWAVAAFVAAWVAVAASNLWIGVAKAGYTVREELPIFLLIAGIPIAVSLLVRWKFR